MKSIYLVNPISGRGHLDAYVRLYSRALIELGYEVVLVSETDGGASAYLERNCPGSQDKFGFSSFEQAQRWNPAPNLSERAGKSAAQRARLVWQDEGMRGLATRCVRIPRRIFRSYVPLSIQNNIARIRRAIVRRALSSRIMRAFNFPIDPDAGRILFQPLLRHVHQVVTMPGRPAPDLVLFLYLDLMAERSQNTAALDRDAWPWTGILFHPRKAADRQAPHEGYFDSSNARGAIFLVPPAIDRYAAALPQQHFVLAPDVADLELPDAPTEMAHEMRRRAGDRTIVLQIGSIMAHKGIPTLLDVINAADPKRFFFALIGEVYWETFAEQEPRVRLAFERTPENVFAHNGYTQSEREYNSLIKTCDVVYAVYQSFNSSSNSLTKASGLGRPILVAANTLMGERVLASGIGAVAPEGDAAGILAALNQLADRPLESFSFGRYKDDHSLESLKLVLAKSVPVWLAESPQINQRFPSPGG